jgi:hypothetical protein
MAFEIAPRGPETDERFDMRAMWRLAVWGGGAAFALILVAVVSVSDGGSPRLAATETPAQPAVARTQLPVRPVATVAVPPFQNPAETKRLAAQVRTLVADRNRLTERVASLEQQLNDLTGSIKRLAEIPVDTPSPPKAVPQAQAPEKPVRQSQAESPAIHAPPATTAVKPWPDRPKLNVEPQADRHEDKPSPPAKQPEAAQSASRETPQQQETTEQETTQQDVPMPPVRVATATQEDISGKFAIALAGASSLEVARLQWAAVKANFGPAIAALQPRAFIERRGSATHYRLVAGPLPTYAAAARLCARIVAAHAICQPVRYGGEPL